MWLKPARLIVAMWFLVELAQSAPRYPDEAHFDAHGAAAAANAQVRAYAGSGAQLNANLARPLMSAQPLTAFDGREFEAQIACPSSVAYLELFAAPGETGDITTLIVKQDLDVDGTLERAYHLPVPVSGACANGVLACDPGTWNHCQAYRWEAKPSGELSLTPGPLADLGGCYCLNAHCGHNLVMSNLAQVLGDFGGGAAAALSRVNPQFMISRVEAAGPVIRFYGQDAGDCGFHGNTNQTHYYTHPHALAADATPATALGLVVPTATVNPTGTVTLDSLYGLITDSAAATTEQNQLYRCTIQRNVTLDEVRLEDIIRYNGGAGGVSACGPGCLQLVIGTVGDDYWCAPCAIQEDRVNFWVERPERIRSATLERVKFDDWMQVIGNDSVIWNGPSGDWTDLNGPPPGRCELGTSWDQHPQADFTPVLHAARGNVALRFRVAVSGCGEGYAFARVRVDESCRLNPDTVVNGCEALETNPNCRLQEETVDGVVTYRHFQPTGLAPLPRAQTIAGQSCAHQPMRNWWRKQRRYGCRTGSAYDFEPAIERAASIQDSATPTGYDDVHLDENGEWITTGYSLQMPKLPSPQTCTQACKTQRPRLANDVAGLGPSQDVRNPKTTDEFFYHECDHRGTCPLGPGETVLKDCQCLNDFAEAAAILQSMRLAGRDMLCTRGTPVALP